MTSKATVLQKAEFNPRIKSYILWYGSLVMVLTIVLLPLLPFWLFLGNIYLNRYFERLECELTTRSLRFKKGYIFQTERTIPLDKIQDLTFKEGPLLKHFGLSILKIETAGNTGQTSADLSLIGIVDAVDFRNMVFEQRDKVTEMSSGTEESENTTEILADIRNTLKSIEQKIQS
ncbi:MAG: PH domain-containing protein [Gracilimonas sp.]|nr:PH domain-containing protein [Gracilimonas sp.]